MHVERFAAVWLALAAALAAACGEDGLKTCGNGAVDAGETCDDGDDDPANGCDLACQPVPGEVWRHDDTDLDDMFFVQGIAVGGDGHVCLAGDRGLAGIVVAFAPDGTELWRKEIDVEGVHAVAADATGACYVHGSTLAKLDADGEVLWMTARTGRPGGMVLGVETVDVLYGDGSSDTAPLRLLRHATKDGAPRWDLGFGDPAAMPAAVDLTLVNTSLAVLASNSPGDFLVVVDAATGTADPPISLDSLGHHDGLRGYDGELLALRGRGDGNGAPAAVQRIGLDGALKWTHEFPDAAVDIIGLAIGPEGSIVASGIVPWGEHRSLLMSMGPDGELLWTIEHPPVAPSTDTGMTIPAFGPNYLVVAGLDFTYDMNNYSLDRIWIRRYGR